MKNKIDNKVAITPHTHPIHPRFHNTSSSNFVIISQIKKLVDMTNQEMIPIRMFFLVSFSSFSRSGFSDFSLLVFCFDFFV